MSDLIKIIDKLDYYKSLDSSLSYIEQPVEVKNNKEYYKNGNVKAYKSYLTVPGLYDSERVRNRDYYLYTDNFNKTYNFLQLKYFVLKYKENTKYLYSKLNTYHKRINAQFKSIDFLLKEELDKIEAVEDMIYKINGNFPIKPNKYDKKYKCDKVFLGSIFRRREKKLKDLEDRFNNDVQSYEKKVACIQREKIENALSEYIYEAKIYKRKQMCKEIEYKYSEMKRGFLEFKEEYKVRLYIDSVFSSFKHEKIYLNQKYTYNVDIDTNSVILNISIPATTIFPVVKEYRVVKKYLSIKPILFKSEELENYQNQALNSYVLSYIYYFMKLNVDGVIRKLYINIYYLNNLDIFTNDYFSGTCIHKSVINLSNGSISFDDTLENQMTSLYGKFLNYSELNYSIRPTMKGRI